jgi:hypothetical protein
MALSRLARCLLPPKLPQRTELAFAAKTFNSSGPNTLHNGLQLDDFIFVVKGSRFITHVKKIRNVEGALANFPRRAYFALTRSWGQYFGSFRTGLLLISKTGSFFKFPTRTMKVAARIAGAHHPRS